MRAAVLVLVLGCGGGLPSEDGAKLTNAARLTAASYAHQDAATAGAALIREAHCDVQQVLVDTKVGPIDSGVPCN